MLKDKFFFSAANILSGSNFDVYVALQGLNQNLDNVGAIYKIDQNENLVLLYESQFFNARDVAVNDQGFVAAGGGSLLKFSPTGGLIYEIPGLTFSEGVAIDNNEFIWHAAVRFEFGENAWLRKHAPNGGLLAENSGLRHQGVCVDENGFVYTSVFDAEDLIFFKLDSNLDTVWTYTEPFNSNWGSCAVDKNGFVYIQAISGELVKLDPSGNFVWRLLRSVEPTAGAIYGIAVDREGFVYSPAGGGTATTLRKISPAGNIVWSFAEYTGSSNGILSVAVDQNGFSYAGARDGTLRKIDPDGNQVAVYTFPYAGALINGVDVFPGRVTISQDL